MIGLREIRKRTPDGVCPFCGEPAARKSDSYSAWLKRQSADRSDFKASCGAPECVTAYHRLYKRDQRAARS